jgi:hypothetical protein
MRADPLDGMVACAETTVACFSAGPPLLPPTTSGDHCRRWLAERAGAAARGADWYYWVAQGYLF